MSTKTKILGKVAIVYKGDYVQNTEYNRLDIVTYNGGSYIAITDNFISTSSSPDIDTVNWKVFARGGVDGVDGVDGKDGEGLTEEQVIAWLENKDIPGQVEDQVQEWLTNNVSTEYQTAVFFGRFNDEWSTPPRYDAGDCVIYEGEIYRCINDNTSSTVWESQNWEKLATASFPDKTLSVTGAAADAKTVGDKFNAIYNSLTPPIIPEEDVNIAIIKKIYPTGSIYITMNSARPGIDFWQGTTWEKIEGRFLLGTGKTISTDTKEYSLEERNGNSNITLQSNNIPAHKHDVELETPIKAQNVTYHYPIVWKRGKLDGESHVVSIDNKPTSNTDYGKSYLVTDKQYSDNPQPIEIMPPYLAVNMWRRTDSDI